MKVKKQPQQVCLGILAAKRELSITNIQFYLSGVYNPDPLTSVPNPIEGISFGLLSDDDINLYLWNATILRGNQVFPLIFYCGDKYPNEPPRIAFTHKVEAIKAPGLNLSDVINPSTGEVYGFVFFHLA